MSKRKETPCNECSEPVCMNILCEPYQRWFCRAWKRINQFAWRQMDKLGRMPRFCYVHPAERCDPVVSPCEKCMCKDWCEKPCSLRLKWWDIQMAKLRHALGYRGCDSE